MYQRVFGAVVNFVKGSARHGTVASDCGHGVILETAKQEPQLHSGIDLIRAHVINSPIESQLAPYPSLTLCHTQHCVASQFVRSCIHCSPAKMLPLMIRCC